jgi:anti-anti-sigma factor
MATHAFHTEVLPVPDLPGASSIRLSGRLTADEARELRESILGEVVETASSRLVFDLAGVERMDTAGAAVLIEAIRAGQDRGIRLLLCAPSEAVVRMFRLAGFENVLDYCCSTPEEVRRRLALPD